MAQDPNLAVGVGDKETHDATSSYQVLSTITQSSSSAESDYDYPTNPLLLVRQIQDNKQLPEEKIELALPAPPPGYLADLSMEEARQKMTTEDLNSLSYNLFENAEASQSLVQDSFSSSGGEESSDFGAEAGEPAIIRQVASPKSKKPKPEPVEDQKIYITGNLVDCNPPQSMDLSSTLLTDEEFADEGIYQGLVMTDVEKKNLGILPESLYMTTNLIKMGDLIESMSLSVPAVAVEVPEVPLPLTSPSLFTRDTITLTPVADTIPKRIPPRKPPRRGISLYS